MFTGIVEELGAVRAIKVGSPVATLVDCFTCHTVLTKDRAGAGGLCDFFAHESSPRTRIRATM